MLFGDGGMVGEWSEHLGSGSKMVRQHGYSGKILKVDLSSGSIIDVPTLDYADRFVGGRGLATKLYLFDVANVVQM